MKRPCFHISSLGRLGSYIPSRNVISKYQTIIKYDYYTIFLSNSIYLKEQSVWALDRGKPRPQN
jgi:hypothetical protein